jgi:hypothetical protein
MIGDASFVGYQIARTPDPNGGDPASAQGQPHPLANHFYQGDCRAILPQFADESIDLIVTSPPYADQRAHTYGGVSPDEYVDWFLPISAELQRVLKPDSSFILNIKERVVKGERHTYVIDLILAMRKQGWLWTEEYCWHKKNSYPGKWPNRFRDAWGKVSALHQAAQVPDVSRGRNGPSGRLGQHPVEVAQ